MRRRILVCLALLLALCLLGDAIAMVCLRSSIDRLGGLAESHRIQTLRSELASSGVRLELDLLALIDAPASGDGSRELPDLERFEDSIESCSGCHHDEWIQAKLDTLRATFDECRERIALVANHGVETIPADEMTLSLAREVVRQSTEMADLAAKHLVARSTDVEASVRRAWVALSVTIVASLIVGGVIAWHLKRRLTRPVEALLDGIERVRAGDIDHRFKIDADEEFRELGDAFNRANASLKNAQEGMLQAEKMAAVGQMAAGIAHEVGNPLASISSVVQMMRREAKTDGERDHLNLIMHHIGRCSQVVRELLTFTRPAPEKPTGEVDINRLLDDTVSLLRYDRRAKNAKIVCHYDEDIRLDRGDSDRLQLVFTNIVLNAFDAMAVCRNGDSRLEISAFKSGEKIVLRFADNGPGMNEEQLRNAFEPFYTTKEPGQGTGLGLWICYQVVRKHGGDIRIEKSDSGGAAVIIELPAMASKAESRGGAARAGRLGFRPTVDA